MAVYDLEFASANDIDTIRGWLVTPLSPEIKGVVHIAHGYGEHFRRYASMITTLADHGFAVAGHDRIGHGLTAKSSGRWGIIGTADPDVFVEDDVRLRAEIDRHYPEAPVVMLGHSLGSLITRSYVARYGSSVAGAILIGTLGELDAMDGAVQDTLSAVERDGVDAECAVLGHVFQGFATHFGENASPMAWDAADPGVVHDYDTDPLSLAQVIPSAGLSAAVCKLWQEVNSPEWYRDVPKSLPMLFLSGQDDPAGGFGSGVRKIEEGLTSHGHHDVRTVLVPGARHEVFNERFARSFVHSEIVQSITGWI